MANQYHLIQDFHGDSQDSHIDEPDVIGVNPYWILAVVRFRFPVTFSRATMSSPNTNSPDAVAVKAPVLVITGDCIQLQTGSNKASHLSSMNATLLHGEINYLSEIIPGDWCAAWMVNSKERAIDIAARLRKGEACNKFDDGLKFLGRISSIRKQLAQQGDGKRIVRYSVQGQGFGEFDSSLFYEPHLTENIEGIASYMARIGTSLNQLILQSGEGIDINEAIPTFLDLLLGKGITANLGIGGNDKRLHSTAGLETGTGEAPYSYIVPEEVGKIIGRTSRSKTGGALAYADLLDCLIGLHRYTHLADNVIASGGISPELIFVPDGTAAKGNRKETGKKLLGTFLPEAPQFTNKSVWTILTQYLNPAVNEMFTCLRVNNEGLVVPTLVVRQLPFSSSLIAKTAGVPPVTPFLELPQWAVHPVLVKSADIGRSDALRFNFIHIYGVGSMADPGATVSHQIVNTPPVRDDQDVKRSGIRPHMQTVNCAIRDIRDAEPKKWIMILADILMGQHLTMTGTLNLVGIQAPICPGDNIVFDGIVFHIEGVTHTCTIDPGGHKDFTTSLSMTHGVRNGEAQDDLHLYAGVEKTDQLQYQPGITYEGTDAAEGETVQKPTKEEEARDKYSRAVVTKVREQ